MVKETNNDEILRLSNKLQTQNRDSQAAQQEMFIQISRTEERMSYYQQEHQRLTDELARMTAENENAVLALKAKYRNDMHAMFEDNARRMAEVEANHRGEMQDMYKTNAEQEDLLRQWIDRYEARDITFRRDYDVLEGHMEAYTSCLRGEYDEGMCNTLVELKMEMIYLTTQARKAHEWGMRMFRKVAKAITRLIDTFKRCIKVYDAYLELHVVLKELEDFQFLEVENEAGPSRPRVPPRAQVRRHPFILEEL
ncbi:hypothetical protein ACFE04_004259 [Oxalis oulophora]